MEFNHYGEKHIDIKLSNKMILFAIDLLFEILDFTMKPFDGSDIPV